LFPKPHVPKGHTVLIYQAEVLFSGDHLAWSGTFTATLYAFAMLVGIHGRNLVSSYTKLATSYNFE
jgi:glyoxylase-like metal-dependent hydrolase (beta-lactamase superfamily II)